MVSDTAFVGGIDVGGTKIEARLFDREWGSIASRRIETPREDYDAFLAALVAQHRWLQNRAGATTLPVGVGVAGLLSPVTGRMLTANLPATGKQLRLDLEREIGALVPFVNDCRAFTLSEARLGAGQDFRSVMGLVIGTGLAGGLAVNGHLLPSANGAAGEYGHIPMAGHLMARHGLDAIACGCGRQGCYETYISGTGIARLSKTLTGVERRAADIATVAAAGDATCARVLGVWLELTCEMLAGLLLTLDPDCIVLGGGVSQIPGLEQMLAQKLPDHLLAGMVAPIFKIAEGGDSSGVRGAALVALNGEDNG
jgi:N-acetylglucosamine kinase